MRSRFDYIAYDSVAVQKQTEAKNLVTELERFADEALPNSRAKSLAITKLEEVYMWLGKAIRDDQIDRGGDGTDKPARGNV